MESRSKTDLGARMEINDTRAAMQRSSASVRCNGEIRELPEARWVQRHPGREDESGRLRQGNGPNSRRRCPPAGFETETRPGVLPVSRLIILEDADHLGSIRQAYLRRMMEKVGNASRFIMVARAPSRIIDALRSRSRMIRIPATDRERIVHTLNSLNVQSNSEASQDVIEDVAYICDGNLRKAIFTLEMLESRGLSADRSAVHKLVQATTLQTGRVLVEMALRGRVVEWKWENKGGRRKRVLVGALAEVDRLMNEHGLDADDVVQQLHDVLIGRRLAIPDTLRDNLLDALAECDTSLRRSMHARVPLERFLHRAAEAGELHGLAFA